MHILHSLSYQAFNCSHTFVRTYLSLSYSSPLTLSWSLISPHQLLCSVLLSMSPDSTLRTGWTPPGTIQRPSVSIPPSTWPTSTWATCTSTTGSLHRWVWMWGVGERVMMGGVGECYCIDSFQGCVKLQSCSGAVPPRRVLPGEQSHLQSYPRRHSCSAYWPHCCWYTHTHTHTDTHTHTHTHTLYC